MNDQTYSDLRSKRCVCQTHYMFCKKKTKGRILVVSVLVNSPQNSRNFVLASAYGGDTT
jgi:hypothetical protein